MEWLSSSTPFARDLDGKRYWTACIIEVGSPAEKGTVTMFGLLGLLGQRLIRCSRVDPGFEGFRQAQHDLDPSSGVHLWL